MIMEELKYEELLPNFQELQNGEKTDGITFASFQKRAQNAVQELVYTSRPNPIMLLNTAGCNQEKCVKDLLLACEHPDRQLNDIIYAENLNNELAPTWLHILSGTAEEFNKQIIELLNKINHKINAEEDFLQIMKKQPGNKKLETYLSDLSIFMAKGGEFTYPVLISTVGIDSANMELLASGKAAPYEVEYWDSEEALLWVGVESEDETLAVLRMNGDVKVVGSDSAEASATADSAGLFGRGLTLAPGQYIDLGSLDPCVGDFTISLWTKWMGPNGEHQILVSQRAYWSDSTSRFQWHYEVNHGVFTVMKSMPNYPEAIVFGDSSIVPIGEWAHLALVSQGGVVTMYVNGEQVGESQEFTPNDLSRPVPLRVGGNEVDTETWNGALDEVRIETVARSAEWVKTAYEAGKSFAE